MSIQGIKKAVITIKDYVTKSPFERLLDEATNEELPVCPVNTLKQIAHSCFEFEFYNVTKNYIWGVLRDKSPNVRKISKTLNLMEYLMFNSTIELVNEFKEEIYYINVLKDLKCTDQSIEFLDAVKTKIKFLVDLLEDTERLKKERTGTQKLAGRISGISSDANPKNPTSTPPKSENAEEKSKKEVGDKPKKETPKNQDQNDQSGIPPEKSLEKEKYQDFSDFGATQPANQKTNEWLDWSKPSNYLAFEKPTNFVASNEVKGVEKTSNNPFEVGFDNFKGSEKISSNPFEEKKTSPNRQDLNTLKAGEIINPNNKFPPPQEKKKELKDYKGMFEQNFASNIRPSNPEPKTSPDLHKPNTKVQQDLLFFDEKTDNDLPQKNLVEGQNQFWATNDLCFG